MGYTNVMHYPEGKQGGMEAGFPVEKAAYFFYRPIRCAKTGKDCRPMSYICVTCGTRYPISSEPPRSCPICQDERQYVGPLGQRWVSLDELQKTHRNVFFEEGDKLWGIHTQPNFAIGQRALLLQTQNGGFLWDCLSLIDTDTIELVKALGGLSAIAISHPHYYTSMVEWSHA